MNSSKLPAAVTLAAAMVLIPSTAHAATSATGSVANRAISVKILEVPSAMKAADPTRVKIIHPLEAELSSKQHVKIISTPYIFPMMRGQRVF